MFYAIFSHGKSTFTSISLFVFTTLLATFITTYYHYLQDPLFHQNMFALLTVIVVFRSIYAMETTLRSSLKSKRTADSSLDLGSDLIEKSRIDARDTAILHMMWKMIACGVGAVAAGFLIWNLDNEFCPTIRRWRREIGLPWGILLEGHGWW
jgi:dihydroceramidase